MSSVIIPSLVIASVVDDPPRGPELQRWYDGHGKPVATGGAHEEGWWVRWPRLATFIFGPAGTVHAIPADANAAARIKDIFRRAVLPIVLMARGCEALHASAVQSTTGVIGFCAVSGTGKSTIAAELARSGLIHFADDVLVYKVTEKPVAVPLPFVARLGAERPDTQRILQAPTASLLARLYHLVRDSSARPDRPTFTAVSNFDRYSRLLTHAHAFEMGPPERQRSFHANLLAVARTTELWECRFAPDRAALPQFTEAIARHALGT